MNSFSKILAASALVAGALSLSTSAHAGTITFGSYAGATPSTFADGSITSPGATVVASTTGYGNAFTGTQYVTYMNGNAPGGVTTSYFTTLTGNLTGYTGSISIFADDLVSIKLNGTAVGSTTGPYNQMYTFALPSADFLASGNTFEFDVTNNGTSANPTAFDFTGTAATPEPSSLILLGSGLISTAGMVIRKRRA